MSMPHVPYVLPNSCFNKYLFSKLFPDSVSSMRNQIYVCVLLLTTPAVNGHEIVVMKQKTYNSKFDKLSVHLNVTYFIADHQINTFIRIQEVGGWS